MKEEALKNMQIILKNGIVYDGTGSLPVKKDILIKDNRIIAVKENITVSDAKILDALGRTVTPGFIDSHRHCDRTALIDPEFGIIELAQGITSVLSGNCGMSLCPSSDFSRQHMYDFIEPCLGKVPENIKLYHYSEYVHILRSVRPAVNIGGFVGLGAIKIAIKGFSKDEIEFLCSLLCEEKGKVGIIVMSMDQDDVDIVAKLPYSMVISDSLYGSSDSPHPRLYGSFSS
ncbi:MAG: hypothetical protein WCD89_25150 [Anaerocolumna sp.]